MARDSMDILGLLYKKGADGDVDFLRGRLAQRIIGAWRHDDGSCGHFQVSPLNDRLPGQVPT